MGLEFWAVEVVFKLSLKMKRRCQERERERETVDEKQRSEKREAIKRSKTDAHKREASGQKRMSLDQFVNSIHTKVQ